MPSEIELPPLPEPDTASLAWSGRSVAYINGYERGFDEAVEKMTAYALLAVKQERERAAKIAEDMRPAGGRMWSEEQAACFAALTDCAQFIRTGSCEN